MQAPKLSIIVPSYNQGAFLEETLLSIIDQQYPQLELIVIDGGSTDNSVKILKKYQDKISYWVSEKDRGQSHAINKGLERATGEWIGWINSDDCYLGGAFKYVFSAIDFDRYDFLYGNCYVGADIKTAVEKRHPASAKASLKDILLFFHHVSHIIPSQSVFMRKSLIDRVGYLREDLHYCMDFEWFCRMYLVTEGRRFFYDKTICFYRVNENTKTGSVTNRGPEEAMAIALEYSKYLLAGDAAYIRKMVNYFTLLRRQMIKPRRSISALLSAAIKYPLIAMRDVRYKTMLKQQLRSMSFFKTTGH